MKVVISGDTLNLDISHVEVDEEREVLVVPMLDFDIQLELSIDDLAELAELAYQNFKGLK
ncbi:MAG: hypothetical protein JRE40_00310 [Deltaproteobacteria bacterium]|nr:hypothetical protein [Deltaproteobacteria bacterium]